MKTRSRRNVLIWMTFVVGMCIGGTAMLYTHQAKAETTDEANASDALKQKWTEIEVTGNPAIRAFWRKAGEMHGCDMLYWRFENALLVPVTITYNVKGKWKSNGGELSIAPKWSAVLAPSDQRQQSLLPAALDQFVCAYKFVSVEVVASDPPPDFSKKKRAAAVAPAEVPAIAAPVPSKEEAAPKTAKSIEAPETRSNAATAKPKLKCLPGKKVYAASCYCPKGTKIVPVDKRSGIVTCRTVDSTLPPTSPAAYDVPRPPAEKKDPLPAKKVVPLVDPSKVMCGG